VDVTRLSWDSALFDLEVGRAVVRSGETVDDARASEAFGVFQLVYVFSEDVLELHGLQLFDTKLIFARPTQWIDVPPGGAIQIDTFDGAREDMGQLCELAVRSGEYSRFRLDPAIPAGKFEELYNEWITKSVTGELAFDVLVARRAGTIVGLTTVGEKPDLAEIGLVAVAEEARGSGIGGALIREAIVRARRRGFRAIQVATQQANVPAVRLYERAGFTLNSRTHVYHYWNI
jgi:ribosomal protein S18 acetylase RimI-like enzyme